MCQIYIKKGLITYSVKTSTIESQSNYNIMLTIKMVGEKFPLWGTIIKSTDNVRKKGNEVINSWLK